jgi:hypothetical protein
MTYYKHVSSESVYPFEHDPGPQYKKMTNKAGKLARAEYCARELREILAPGDTIYCVLRNVSKSGMSRRIDLYKMIDEEPRYLSQLVADATDHKMSDAGGIVVGGCGMDMGFHLVYCLGRVLWPEGFGTLSLGGIRPVSREDAAQLVAEGKTQFRGRNGDSTGWDSDGGYALKSSWL